MKDIIEKVINCISIPSIQFGDVRATASDEEGFYFEKGILKSYTKEMNHRSVGIRVLVEGCWGFAGTNDLSETSIDRAIRRAVENAEQGALFKKDPVRFDPITPISITAFQKPEKDPFILDKDEKIRTLSKLAGQLEGHSQIVFNFLMASFFRLHKMYANTEGSYCDFLTYHTMPFFKVISSDGEHIQTRTVPGDMSAKTGGFEIFTDYKMEDRIETVVKEAVDLLKAPMIEDEKADLIIGGSQLALQLHESVGHATEADRIFGMEISYAGKTFVKEDYLGKFRYGSEQVNIVSDSTDIRAMGYHPMDDEGVPARKMDVIRNGVLVGLQTSREVAYRLGIEPSSNMKASYAFDYPLVRMTNLNLLPGNAGSLDDLIASTRKGYLVDYTKCWSIDDNRNNFQFTTEIGWKIEDGKITGIVKEPTYYGITPEFWNSCDAVCSESEWQYFGTFFCGKGEPGQLMHLSHGVAPARFKNVVVNVKA